MDNTKKYIPISCHFHDELELLALRATPCKIVYQENKESIELQDIRIKTWISNAAGEFLVLENEQQIRLDQLISVNGLQLANYSCDL